MPTHCDPTLTNHIPVPQFPGGVVTNLPGGSKRGVVVIMQGLQTHAVSTPIAVYNTAGYPGGILPLGYLDFSNQLVADGWATIFAPTPGQLWPTYQSAGYQTTLNADNGTGITNTNTLWWDHVVNYIQTSLGTTWPIVAFGVSLGGFLAAQIATLKTSTISAYGAHCASLALWSALPGVLNLSATGFYNTFDWTATVASGSNGASLPVATLNITGLTGATPASVGTLIIQRGATGNWQWVNYTGFNGSTQFTGCTGGNTQYGNLATGDVVAHSVNTINSDISTTGLNALGNGQQGTSFTGTTPIGWIGCEVNDLFIGYADQQKVANNAIAASQPVTLYTNAGGGHQFGSADVTAAISWFTGTVDPLCPAVH